MAAKISYPPVGQDPLVRGDTWSIPVAFRVAGANQDPTGWTFRPSVIRREADSAVIAQFTQSIVAGQYVDENNVSITVLLLSLDSTLSALVRNGDVVDVRSLTPSFEDWIIYTLRVDKDVSHV